MRNLCETLCGWHKELSESNPIPSVLVAIRMREFNCTLNYPRRTCGKLLAS